MHAMTDRKNAIIGLGHPRCGTGFTANTLIAGGIKVGHERMKQDGIVSWLSASEYTETPWGNGHHRPILPSDLVFCTARSFLSAIPSVIAENRIPASFDFRRKVLKDYSGVDLGDEADVPRNEINIAVAGMALWYEMCLDKNPRFVFRVDHPEDDKLFQTFLGIDISREKSVPRNSRPRLKSGIRFEIKDLEMLSIRWARKCMEVMIRLGYLDDAKTLELFLR